MNARPSFFDTACQIVSPPTPAMDPTTAVCWSQGSDLGEGTLGDFCAANRIEPVERAMIEHALLRGRTYFGDGLFAEWKLWLDSGTDSPTVCAHCGGTGWVRRGVDAFGLRAAERREAEARANREATPCPAGCRDWSNALSEAAALERRADEITGEHSMAVA